MEMKRGDFEVKIRKIQQKRKYKTHSLKLTQMNHTKLINLYIQIYKRAHQTIYNKFKSSQNPFQKMGFPYIIQLQNVDTNERIYHSILSSKPDQIFNQKQQINYNSILEFILMYEPQCDKDMLLIMYQENDLWIFMSSEFFIDLNKLNLIEDPVDKTKISKFGSKISPMTNSQITHPHSDSNKIPDKHKIILSVRFQCQLWVDQPENFWQKSLGSQKSYYSQKDSHIINLMEKVKEISSKIKQIDEFAHDLQQIEAESLGINIFWASPYFATDGILRKQPKRHEKKRQQIKDGKIDYLKNSVKCIPYVNAITQQILQSNKKVVLNIDQFNNLSFARRNIFKVVYLVCHTQVTEVKRKQYQQKFKRSINQNFNDNASTISDNSFKNQFFGMMEQVKVQSIKIDKLQHIEEQNQEQPPHSINIKRADSVELQDTNSFLGLQRIQQEKESDNMTQRKESIDFNAFKDNDPTEDDLLHSLHRGVSEQVKYSSLSSENKNQKSAEKMISEESYLEKAFDIKQGNNTIFSAYQQDQFEFERVKDKMSKTRRNRLSRSNSRKSAESHGNENSKRSKSKRNLDQQSSKNILNAFKQQVAHGQNNVQFDLKNSAIKKTKRYDKKQKKQYKKLVKPVEFPNKEENQKEAITYLIGENKFGQLQKITPQDLDEMLSEKKLENIQLFIIHTSYPSAHLPILKKHANNILVINSNPMFPEACTVFYLKSFFKHLFELKNIRLAHQKSLLQTTYLYKGDSSDFSIQKMLRLYSVDKSSLQKLYFEPFMDLINKKYIHGGPYLCCCYHPHEYWCTFRTNKSTSKYAECHYKFHINRCECKFSNPMDHSCESKRQTLGIYNIIDKKKYTSQLFYDCCCLGVRLGRYKHRRKNTECNLPIDQESLDDPHDISQKYLFIKSYETKDKTNSNQNISLPNLQKAVSSDQKPKELLSIEDGVVEGSCNPEFLDSLKYLSENDLIGNSQIIVQTLAFFGGNFEAAANQSEIRVDFELKRNDSKISTESNMTTSILASTQKPQKITNSMIRQSIIKEPKKDKNQDKNIYSNQPRICNLHGENSSGRKTIGKYLGHLMILKNMYEKIQVKYFTKVEDLKFLELDPKVATFYILIYKSAKRHQQINLDQISLSAQNLPPSLNAIIITNKKINFDKSIIFVHKTPKPFNKEQIQTYIKMYEHLSRQQKLKLKTFMDLTDLNQKNKNKTDDQNEQGATKIYANRIDPYEIITVIRKSNYQNLKYLKYLESVSKINSRSLPQYLFIAGTLFEALKHYDSFDSRLMRRQKTYFISKITQKLKSFITDNKSFYLFFDPKRNKNKSKKLTDDRKKPKTPKQIEKEDEKLKNSDNQKSKQSQSQQEKTFKEDIIRAIDISEFFILNFQKFRKEISSRPLDTLKYFIFYTTLHEKNVYSLKERHYSKGCENLQKQKSAQDITSFYTRKIVYDHEFYESTSQNKKSFLYRVLRKQIEEYGTFLQPKNASNENKNPKMAKNLSQKGKQENAILINLQKVAKQANEQIFEHQKNSLNQFFSFYSLTFKQKNQKTSKHGAYERKDSFSPTNPFLKERHSLLTPNKELYQSPTNKYPRSQSCVLARSQKKADQMQESKKITQKLKKKDSYLDFKNEQLHLHFIMSAGLTYLRSILCSHLVYNLLDSKVILSIIKAGLILINNALLLMKTPDYKHPPDRSHSQDDSQFESQCQSYEINEAQVQSQNSEQNSNVFQRSQSVLLPQNLEAIKTKSSNLGFSQTMRHKSTFQEKKNMENIESQLNNLFSIKGLLYLLYKIRQRCDGLILIFTNDNSRSEVHQVTKMCIISELLMLQLHIMNLSQGQNYQNTISNLKLNQLSKSEKYLTSIFFDKSRSLNYIRESLHFAKFSSEQEEMIQNHFLSAYIMIATNYGRKKINQILSHEINKIKSQFDDKAGRKDSVHDLPFQTKIQDDKLSDKMKILLKISQNRQIFLKVFSIYESFNLQLAIRQQNLESSRKKSTQNHKYRSEQKISENINHELDLIMSRANSNRIKPKHYESQSELFLELIGLYHQFEQSLHEDSASLYLSLERYKKNLMNDSIVHGLKFCSRYVNAFHEDFLNRIEKHNMLLKQKIVLFFTADPIQFNKSASSASSKEHFDSNEQFQINKKKIQYEGNNKTIILGCDVSQLQQKIGFSKSNNSALRDSVLETTFINEGTSTHFNETSSRKGLDFNKPSYNYFTLNKKLNEQNLKEFSKSFGCKYLCIDTMMCLNNLKNQVIGETQEGEMLIFRKQRLRQLIEDLSASVVFICLHNGYLATDMITKWTKKEIIYFNFEKVNQNLEKKISSESHLSSTSSFREFKSDMLYTYYRMIMRKVVHLIIEKLVQDSSDHSHTQKIVDALSFVLYSFEFCIKNAAGDTIFTLSNSELRHSVFTLSKFNLSPPQSLIHPMKIILLEDDIVSIEEVQQVKTVLKHKYNTKEQKDPVRIQHIKSFQKFFKIFKFYLQDKQNYHDFFEIDLEKFKHPNRDPQISLRNVRSDQSNLSIPSSLTKCQSTISKQSKGSTDRKKKEKKNKEPKYANRWKSEFVKYLLKQNLLNLYLSNKKCFVMFTNSDLMAQKGQKQDWARYVFDNLFKIQNCDTGEQLNRIVTEVKIGIPKKGEKKPSKIATLFFMETRKPHIA